MVYLPTNCQLLGIPIGYPIGQGEANYFDATSQNLPIFFSNVPLDFVKYYIAFSMFLFHFY